MQDSYQNIFPRGLVGLWVPDRRIYFSHSGGRKKTRSSLDWPSRLCALGPTLASDTSALVQNLPWFEDRQDLAKIKHVGNQTTESINRNRI